MDARADPYDGAGSGVGAALWQGWGTRLACGIRYWHVHVLLASL